jgi:hypothetical protein
MSAFDALADELGAVAGRIEREVTLRVTAALSDFACRDAQRELAFANKLQQIDGLIEARLASVKDGIDGKDGAPGRDGVDGAPGRDGIAGKDGTNGKDGEPGIAGLDGIDGKDGAPGRDGVDGLPGTPGIDGEPGARGADGAPGKLPQVKAWSDGVHYEGSVVVHRGSAYQASRDTGKEPGNNDDWFCIAARGQDGLGFRIRGTYSADASYVANDVAACNGGSFVALKDAPGVCPGPDWQLLAGPGKRGDKGLTGDRGPQGQSGKPGEVISSWSINPKDYTAEPIMSDGSRGPVVQLRDMFEQFIIETS